MSFPVIKCQPTSHKTFLRKYLTNLNCYSHCYALYCNALYCTVLYCTALTCGGHRGHHSLRRALLLVYLVHCGAGSGHGGDQGEEDDVVHGDGGSCTTTGVSPPPTHCGLGLARLCLPCTVNQSDTQAGTSPSHWDDDITGCYSTRRKHTRADYPQWQSTLRTLRSKSILKVSNVFTTIYFSTVWCLKTNN